jgi:uncharacterized protein with PIN domain
MAQSKEDLEARLMKQAESAIGRMLEAKGARRDLSLSEMEDLVGKLEHELRQSLMQEMVEEVEEPSISVCESCGGALRYKGRKKRRIVSVRGEVEVERDYYHCEVCKQGYFPPG